MPIHNSKFKIQHSPPSGDSLPVRIYSPEPLLGHPVTLIKNIIKDLLAGRELAWRLFIRDLSAQYRQTYFG